MKRPLDLPHLGLALLIAVSGGLATAGEAISVRSYDAPDGETYLSIELTPAADAIQGETRQDHVILVDTSASQIGEYRTRQLDVVRGMISALPETDRVAVMAVDLDAEPLTPGLVTARDAEEIALPALEKRFPAGATNLLRGLNAAQAVLDGPAGSIMFVGDGMSAAHLLQEQEMKDLVTSLRDQQIAVHGFAVGSNRDVQLLGMLAQQTGGRVFLDDWRDDAGQNSSALGNEIATALRQPVMYPTELSAAKSILPQTALPLRADRPTVYVANGNVIGESIALTTADQQETKWTIPESGSTQGNTYLYYLWQDAKSQPVLGIGLSGSEMLAYAQTSFEDRVAAMEAVGQQALFDKNFKEAEEVGFAIRRIDPNNARAVGFINASAQQSDEPLQIAQNDDAAPAAGDPLQDRTTPAKDASLIDAAKEAQGVREQRLQLQIDDSKEASRQALRVNPNESRDIVDRMRNTVKADNTISPEARDRMLRDLNTFQLYVESESVRRESEIAAQERSRLIDAASAELIEHNELLDERMKALVDRVRGLMSDFREGDDNAAQEAELVGTLISNLRPGNPYGMAARHVAEAATQLRRAERLRALRADRFLEALYQVELSHVPFPDEPPVRYPPAEVWQALTERRKKWNSVDLTKPNANEQRIYDSLDMKVDFEFIDTELSEAIRFIADRYEIPIIPDETRMADLGIGLDTPVTLVISGITLRSALKLMLEPQDLTYIVEDEVMKITTIEYATSVLQTRVYPVADLVIPIQPILGNLGGSALGGGGLGGGQQGGGGFGQGGGGFGGGGGGFGGGQGGGGGFGGGGFFSVPTSPEDVFNQNLQKKTP